MQNLRNKLIAGGAVLTLAALGTVMNRQAAQAQGGPTVTIGAPIPLPVEARQVGTWNVGLTGTPNVNVANKITVANTPTTAGPTVSAPAASQLVTQNCNAFYANSSDARCTFGPTPADKTLFIESASIHIQVFPGFAPSLAYIFNDASGFIFIPMFQQASSNGARDNFVGTPSGRISSPAGAAPGCDVALNNNTPGGIIECAINGYFAPAQ